MPSSASVCSALPCPWSASRAASCSLFTISILLPTAPAAGHERVSRRAGRVAGGPHGARGSRGGGAPTPCANDDGQTFRDVHFLSGRCDAARQDRWCEPGAVEPLVRRWVAGTADPAISADPELHPIDEPLLLCVESLSTPIGRCDRLSRPWLTICVDVPRAAPTYAPLQLSQRNRPKSPI